MTTPYVIPAWLLSVLIHGAVISLLWQGRPAEIFLKRGAYAVDVTLVSAWPGIPGKAGVTETAPPQQTEAAPIVGPALQAPPLPALKLAAKTTKPAPTIRKASLRMAKAGSAAPKAINGEAGQGEGGSGGAGGVAAAAGLLEGSAYPDYPAAARRRGQEGRVVYEVRISSDGKLAAAKLITSSRFPLLDDAARRALEQATYRPAIQGFRAVDAVKRIAFVFKLEGL